MCRNLCEDGASEADLNSLPSRSFIEDRVHEVITKTVAAAAATSAHSKTHNLHSVAKGFHAW